MKFKLILILVCGVFIYNIEAQSQKLDSSETLHSENVVKPVNEHLLKYANVLIDISSDATIRLANEELKGEAINGTYNALVSNTLSDDQSSELYKYIINRTVKNDWTPELKTLALYLIKKRSVDDAGQPLYMMNRNELLSRTVLDLFEIIPALDPARGNDNLTEAQEQQLLREKVVELKANNTEMYKYIAAFE